jgi:hypothetical protein
MPRLRPRAVLTERDRRLRPMSAPEAAAAAPDGGQYLSRLVAYIPAETITAHQAFRGFVPESDRMAVMPVLEALLIVATPIWVAYMTREKTEPVAWHQVLISGLAFIVWLLAVKAALVSSLPFAWADYYGSILMVGCGVLIFPMLERFFRNAP